MWVLSSTGLFRENRLFGFLQYGRSKLYEHVKPIIMILQLVWFYFHKEKLGYGVGRYTYSTYEHPYTVSYYVLLLHPSTVRDGLSCYVDFTFALLDITVWYEFARIKIGWKFISLTSACSVQFRLYNTLLYFQMRSFLWTILSLVAVSSGVPQRLGRQTPTQDPVFCQVRTRV